MSCSHAAIIRSISGSASSLSDLSAADTASRTGQACRQCSSTLTGGLALLPPNSDRVAQLHQLATSLPSILSLISNGPPETLPSSSSNKQPPKSFKIPPSLLLRVKGPRDGSPSAKAPAGESESRPKPKPSKKAGQKSGKAQLREEGLEKTDNYLPQTSWPVVGMINQKNYYTEYLKREDQYLAYRTNQEAASKEREGAGNGYENGMDEDTIMEDSSHEPHGSKVIVIHPGSLNLRIGLAYDAVPKTVPMCIARKDTQTELEANSSEAVPRRIGVDGVLPHEPERLFGEEFDNTMKKMVAELRRNMQLNKRKLMPNSRELVINHNRRQLPETISEHNDPNRIEWTDVAGKHASDYYTGMAALRVPQDSVPKYKLLWPIKNGLFNERDYKQRELLLTDYFRIIEDAIKYDLNIKRKDWSQYSCVFVIPDLYEKFLIVEALHECMVGFGFRRICFIQESLAASFGAGYSISCVVDVGASKTSICCVEDGMCVEDSRINLKYGGWDVTELFLKMMLHDHFPYTEIDLNKRHDFLLAEELKAQHITMDDSNLPIPSVNLEFHLRISGQDTKKYSWRAYDEVLLCAMGYYHPELFNLDGKFEGRRTLLDRSYDIYDGTPNDPTSTAQQSVLDFAAATYPTARHKLPIPTAAHPGVTATPGVRPQGFNFLSRVMDIDGTSTPRSSNAGSPAPESGTPAERPGTPSARDENEGPAGGGTGTGGGANADHLLYSERLRLAEEADHTLPIMPLDQAIIESVRKGCRGEDKKMRDFFGGIMIVGGGAKMPGFTTYMEYRLRNLMPGFTKEILVGLPPREMDQEQVAWKGGTVFGRLSSSGNDSWIYQKEYDLLGAKLLYQKLLFQF